MGYFVDPISLETCRKVKTWKALSHLCAESTLEYRHFQPCIVEKFTDHRFSLTFPSGRGLAEKDDVAVLLLEHETIVQFQRLKEV